MKYCLIPLVLLAGCASAPENNCPVSSYNAQWACQRPPLVQNTHSWKRMTRANAAELIQRGDLLAHQVATHELTDTQAQQKWFDYADAIESRRYQALSAYGAVRPQQVRIIP